MTRRAQCAQCNKGVIFKHEVCSKHALCIDHISKLYVPERCGACTSVRDSRNRDDVRVLKEDIRKTQTSGFVWNPHFKNWFGDLAKRAGQGEKKGNAGDSELDSKSRSRSRSPVIPRSDQAVAGGSAQAAPLTPGKGPASSSQYWLSNGLDGSGKGPVAAGNNQAGCSVPPTPGKLQSSSSQQWFTNELDGSGRGPVGTGSNLARGPGKPVSSRYNPHGTIKNGEEALENLSGPPSGPADLAAYQQSQRLSDQQWSYGPGPFYGPATQAGAGHHQKQGADGGTSEPATLSGTSASTDFMHYTNQPVGPQGPLAQSNTGLPTTGWNAGWSHTSGDAHSSNTNQPLYTNQGQGWGPSGSGAGYNPMIRNPGNRTNEGEFDWANRQKGFAAESANTRQAQTGNLGSNYVYQGPCSAPPTCTSSTRAPRDPWDSTHTSPQEPTGGAPDRMSGQATQGGPEFAHSRPPPMRQGPQFAATAERQDWQDNPYQHYNVRQEPYSVPSGPGPSTLPRGESGHLGGRDRFTAPQPNGRFGGASAEHRVTSESESDDSEEDGHAPGGGRGTPQSRDHMSKDKIIEYLLRKVTELGGDKDIAAQSSWINTRETEVVREGERATIDGSVYEFLVDESDPSWISLDTKVDPSQRLSLSSTKVEEAAEEIFGHKALPNREQGPPLKFTSRMEDWGPAQRIFKALHDSYMPLVSAKSSAGSTKNAEKQIHKELLGKNQLLYAQPSDFLGLMSAEEYQKWARDAEIDVLASQEGLKLPFELQVPQANLEAERRARRSVVRLHTCVIHLIATGQAVPDMFANMSAIAHTLLPDLYERTKAWLDCKYQCRAVALQMQKSHAAVCLLQSNPWNHRLFDVKSAGVGETDHMKTFGWGKTLGIDEKTARAIKSNSKCVDWSKGKINAPAPAFRPFRGFRATRSKGNAHSQVRGSYSSAGPRFKPYNVGESRQANKGFSRAGPSGVEKPRTAQKPTSSRGGRSNKEHKGWTGKKFSKSS